MGIVQGLLLATSLAAADVAASPGEADFTARCEADGRRLWGVSLCAPVVVVDPATDAFRTSRPAPGALPPLRANTGFDWGGERWIMLLEPLPGDPAELASLLFHEAWHVHQEALGLPANNSVAAHLDGAMARYWMRLEWAALDRALVSSGAERRGHVAQALAFRRRRLDGGAERAEAERLQMRHEGLAAYTGVALSGDSLRLARAALRDGPTRPGLARSFAYASGPAWGLLLDAMRPGWRQRRDQVDLAEMIPVGAAALARADDYGGTAILGEETAAAAERERLIATAVAATAEGRGLRLPLAQIGMDYDPNRVSSAPDGSTLYHRITLRDRWGSIRVEGIGLRVLPDFSAAFAPWPLPEGALELAPGWRVAPRAEGGARLVPPPG